MIYEKDDEYEDINRKVESRLEEGHYKHNSHKAK